MRLVDTQTIDGDVLHLTYERSRNAMRAAVASIAVAASLSLLVPACVIDGTTTRSPDVVSMPNVLGLNYREARRELESMCFVVEIRLYNARSVTKQQATPGQEVEARGRDRGKTAVAVGQHHVEDDHRGGYGLAGSRASATVPTAIASNPSRPRCATSGSAIPGSSSTTRMRVPMARACIVGARATWARRRMASGTLSPYPGHADLRVDGSSARSAPDAISRCPNRVLGRCLSAVSYARFDVGSLPG